MIEGTREEIEVAVQRPEVAEREVQGGLRHDVLAVPAEVPLASREQVDGIVLEGAARPGLPVDEVHIPKTTVGVAEPAGVVGVVPRRLPAVVEVVQPAPVGLAELDVGDGPGERGAFGIVGDVVRVGALEEVHR